MKIKKMYQGNVPDNKILNTQSDSQTDTYSCDYLNNSVVVESGTTGMWRYKKWSDGTAECWGRYTMSSKMENTWGSLSVSNIDTGRQDYPFEFIEIPNEIVTARTSANACFVYAESDSGGLNTKTQTGKYRVARPGAASTVNTIHFDFYVSGKWK